MIEVDLKGKPIPALGFGTFRLTGDGCERSVFEALAVGYRHIDTAQMYGNEAEVGAALERSGLARDRSLSPPRCGRVSWLRRTYAPRSWAVSTICASNGSTSL